MSKHRWKEMIIGLKELEEFLKKSKPKISNLGHIINLLRKTVDNPHI